MMTRGRVFLTILAAFTLSAFGQPFFGASTPPVAAGGAGPAFNSVQAYGSSVVENTMTLPATVPSGSDRLLIVCVVIRDGTDVYNIDTVKLGGSTGTALTKYGIDYKHSSGHAEMSLYYALETDISGYSGAQDIDAALPGNDDSRGVVTAMWFTGVTQGDPLGTPVEDEGTGAGASLAVTVGTDEMAYLCYGNDDEGTGDPLGAMTGDGTQRSLQDETVSGARKWSAITATNTATGTFGWDSPDTQSWTLVGIPVQ